MKDKQLTFKISEYFTLSALWITLILIIGFVLAADSADVISMKTGSNGLDAGGKIIRVASALVAGAFAFLSLFRSNSFPYLLKGNLGIIFIFSCLAYFSVVFSELRMMTIYKSSELILMLFIVATLYGKSIPFIASRKYLFGLFWIYIITAIGVLAQLAYYGPGEYKQLHYTPFITFMLSSKHPPLAANSVGLLGALVAMFGMYQFYRCDSKKTKCYILGGFIGILGVTVLVLSYTRSALALFVLSAVIFLYFNRKYALLTATGFLVILLLAVGSTREIVESHMRRGDSDQNIATLSSRAIFWENIIHKPPLRLIIGDGYATGSIFQNYTEGSKDIFWAKNVHNSVFEIINSTGIIGAIVWITLIVRINIQLIRHLLRSKKFVSKEEYLFHLFITSTFILTSLRSIMNSTFVYLDYFLPLLFAIAVYADSLKSRRNEIYEEKNSLNVESEDIVGASEDRDIKSKISILSYKKN